MRIPFVLKCRLEWNLNLTDQSIMQSSYNLAQYHPLFSWNERCLNSDAFRKQNFSNKAQCTEKKKTTEMSQFRLRLVSGKQRQEEVPK